MAEEQKLFLSPRRVAERWECSTRKVQYLIAQGDLPAMHLGPKLVRVPLAALEAYEASLIRGEITAPVSAPEPPKAGVMNPARLAALRRRLTRSG